MKTKGTSVWGAAIACLMVAGAVSAEPGQDQNASASLSFGYNAQQTNIDFTWSVTQQPNCNQLNVFGIGNWLNLQITFNSAQNTRAQEQWLVTYQVEIYRWDNVANVALLGLGPIYNSGVLQDANNPVQPSGWTAGTVVNANAQYTGWNGGPSQCTFFLIVDVWVTESQPRGWSFNFWHTGIW